MNVWRDLYLHPTLISVGFAIAAVLVAGFLVVLAMRRGRGQRGTRWLEVFRLVVVVCVAATLLQPEWRRELEPERKPQLAVLWDASPSMETEDLTELPDPSGADAAEGPPYSRAEFLERLLAREPFVPLHERFEVHVESYSAPDEGDGGTDLSAALTGAMERHDHLRAVALFGDGDWNEGDPPAEAAMRLRTRGVPVYAVPIGREVPLPDVELAALDPPTFSVVGRTLQIPFTVKSTLPRARVVNVNMEVGDGTTQTRSVELPAFGEVRDVFTWKPKRLGDEAVRVDVERTEEDTLADNNSREVQVSVRAEALRVLVVDSVPRWEYRYLRNALERDPGVEVTCLLFHPGLGKRGGGPGYIKEFPEEPEELGRFDVIFLGDVGVSPEELTEAQCTNLAGVVREQASGLVFIPGRRGRQMDLVQTDLAELLPVQFDEAQPRGFGSSMPSRFMLTESGRRSLLTRLSDDENENHVLWRNLPGCNWRSAAVRARPGSEVLAVHEGSRAPLLVTRTYGTGKVLFMGTDAAWRWREGVEDRYHYRFWGQVARWMAYQRHMAAGEMLRFFFTPDRPRPRGTMTLFATVLDPTGAPLGDATLEAEIRGPQGDVERVALRVSNADWGLYSAQYTPAAAGDYAVKLECAETGAVLETQWTVQGLRRERIGQPARPEVFAEIASISRGESLAAADLETMIDRLAALPEPEPEVRRVRLWAHPVWATILVTLLSAFWIGRKLQGAY